MTVRQDQLPNGFRIVSEHMPSLQSAAIGIWVTAGGRHERLRRERELLAARARAMHRAAGVAERRAEHAAQPCVRAGQPRADPGEIRHPRGHREVSIRLGRVARRRGRTHARVIGGARGGGRSVSRVHRDPVEAVARRTPRPQPLRDRGNQIGRKSAPTSFLGSALCARLARASAR